MLLETYPDEATPAARLPRPVSAIPVFDLRLRGNGDTFNFLVDSILCR